MALSSAHHKETQLSQREHCYSHVYVQTWKESKVELSNVANVSLAEAGVVLIQSLVTGLTFHYSPHAASVITCFLGWQASFKTLRDMALPHLRLQHLSPLLTLLESYWSPRTFLNMQRAFPLWSFNTCCSLCLKISSARYLHGSGLRLALCSQGILIKGALVGHPS